jgi:hypothetical protein
VEHDIVVVSPLSKGRKVLARLRRMLIVEFNCDRALFDREPIGWNRPKANSPCSSPVPHPSPFSSSRVLRRAAEGGITTVKGAKDGMRIGKSCPGCNYVISRFLFHVTFRRCYSRLGSASCRCFCDRELRTFVLVLAVPISYAFLLTPSCMASSHPVSMIKMKYTSRCKARQGVLFLSIDTERTFLDHARSL